MSEEVEQESTAKSFKGIIITLVSTVTLGVGGFVTNKITGGGDEAAPVQQAAPVINIQNTQQQSAGKTVIVNGGGGGNNGGTAKPAEPAKPVKKKEGDEFKEKPAEW
jgi:hypothetical protein